MNEARVYAFPNRNTPSDPVIFDPEVCNGCNMCINVCLADLLIPNPDKGQPPIILYPEECWYEGTCVIHCPNAGAIKLNLPLTQRVRWKRKASREHFRI